MHHPYILIIKSKLYQLLIKWNKLVQSGALELMKAPKKYRLIVKIQRLRKRLERLGPLTGKLALLTGASLFGGDMLQAQPLNLNIFRNDNQVNPFGLVPIDAEESTPVFVDIDRDGDFDLFSGSSYGYTFFAENIGTSTEPEFSIMQTDPFGIDLDSIYTATAFADIDGDGDLDLFAGTGDGVILFQENIGTATAPSFASAEVSPFNIGVQTSVIEESGSTYVGQLITSYSAITFGDIDMDGDLDAFIGNGKGDVHFFENTGSSTSPMFSYNADPDLNIYGYGYGEAAPQMCDVDGDGDLDMFIGLASGYTFLGYNGGGESSASIGNLMFIGYDYFKFDDLGSFTHPGLVDIDGDGDLDMFIGNDDGDFHFFPGRIQGYPYYGYGAGALVDQSMTPNGLYRSSGTNSVMVDIDDDGDKDLFYIGSGDVFFAENVGTPFVPTFAGTNSTQYDIAFYGEESAGHIAFADLDMDGDLDAIVQIEDSAAVKMFINDPSSNGAFFSSGYYNNDPGGLDIPADVDFSFVDIDDDGDLDVLFRNGKAVYLITNNGYYNAGTFINDFSGSAEFLIFSSFDIAGAPQMVDLDYDGDLDMIFGTTDEDDYDFIGYSFNPSESATAGTEFTSSFFADGFYLGTLNSYSDLVNPEHISFVDIDSDGDLDLLATSENGLAYFLKNINCTYYKYANHFLPHRSVYNAQGFVLSNGMVPPGRDVIFEAGGEISLLEEFEVKEDNISPTENPTFEARIGGCAEELPPPPPILYSQPQQKEEKSKAKESIKIKKMNWLNKGERASLSQDNDLRKKSKRSYQRPKE